MARGPVRGYAPTDLAQDVFEEGDAIIYAAIEPAPIDAGWVLVSVSVPESRREDRYQLRKRLLWWGMGNLGGGLWVAPVRILPTVLTWVRRSGFEQYVDVFSARYEGFATVDDFVARCWDLAALGEAYAWYISEWSATAQRLRKRHAAPGPEQAFALYTVALEGWLRFPYVDPRLPAEFVPAGWKGPEAQHLFDELRERLEAPAFAFVRSVVARGGSSARG